VTGADGFIGSHLVEALVDKGFDVRAFVLYNSFNSWGWLDRVPEAVRNRLDVLTFSQETSGILTECMLRCEIATS
jgi:nucleoside-diphosphate-sugar epimerase